MIRRQTIQYCTSIKRPVRPISTFFFNDWNCMFECAFINHVTFPLDSFFFNYLLYKSVPLFSDKRKKKGFFFFLLILWLKSFAFFYFQQYYISWFYNSIILSFWSRWFNGKALFMDYLLYKSYHSLWKIRIMTFVDNMLWL